MKKLLKTAIVMVLCLSVLSTNCYAAEKGKQTKLSMKNTYSSGYKMNKAQKAFWKDVMKEYRKGTKKKVEFATDMTVEEMRELANTRKMIKEVRYADAEYNIGMYSLVSYTDDDKLYITINMKKVGKMVRSSRRNEKSIDKAIKEMKLSKKTTQKTAAIKIHDYLVKTMRYDYTYKRGSLSDAFKGVSVCSGYAHAYEAICDKVGLKCDYIRGYANNGAHGWNRVKINGKWKYIDVTWDDCRSDEEYLLISKSKMSRDHVQYEVLK